jgi:hypothetical protein
MSITRTAGSILKSLEKYLEFLSGLNEEHFQRCPAEGVWSLSEVYSHIISANKGSFIAIERCLHETKSLSGGSQWQARLILFFGIFPPGKIKAPEKVAAMVQKISTEEARNGIITLRERIPEIVDLVRKSSPDKKSKHPRLGLLNARQWLRFIEIHSIHHLKQLKRINTTLLEKA